MSEKQKKKFEVPTQANKKGSIGIRAGLTSNVPWTTPDRLEGDSVDEHEHLEAANEEIAEDEIMQQYNNL